jgi:hypothetical protein
VDQVLDSKPWPEGLRRKAHWDFVLEEMVWMANDFMQVPEFYMFLNTLCEGSIAQSKWV